MKPDFKSLKSLTPDLDSLKSGLEPLEYFKSLKSLKTLKFGQKSLKSRNPGIWCTSPKTVIGPSAGTGIFQNTQPRNFYFFRRVHWSFRYFERVSAVSHIPQSRARSLCTHIMTSQRLRLLARPKYMPHILGKAKETSFGLSFIYFLFCIMRIVDFLWKRVPAQMRLGSLRNLNQSRTICAD